MSVFCDPAVEVAVVGGVIGGDVRAVGDLAAAARMIAADPAEMLVVIGPGTFIDDALAFTAVLQLARPAAGVVLVRDKIDDRLRSRALEHGVRHVVAARDDWALAAACERSRAQSAAMVGGALAAATKATAESEIITVFAPKGGVGKTTFATNLGAVLAGEGHDVCVVDLSLASGDIAISLQLDPVRTLADAVPMAGHLDTDGAASLLTRYRPGLEILLAPVVPGEAEKVTAGLVSELLGVLRSMFRYVVVDTGAYLSAQVLAAIDVSARLVLIATPDMPALKSLRATRDILETLSFATASRSIVVNRSVSNAGLSTEDVLRVLRAPVAAHIPSSRAVTASINSGTPIALSNRRHPVSRAIARFAHECLLTAPVSKPSFRSRQPGRGARWLG